MIKGFTTSEGTKRFSEKFPAALKNQFYRPFMGLTFSAVGLGTYLGDPTDAVDKSSYDAARECVLNGVQVIDAAINYRAQRSERVIGRVIQDLIQHKKINRDEIFISTKGGFIPFDGNYPEDSFQFIFEHFVESGILSESEVIQGCHAMTPKYLENQLEQSLKNLNLETIDLYYVHNPETQLEELTENEFYSALTKAFELLEKKVSEGKIKMYGTATWNGYRTPKNEHGYLSLARVLESAKAAGGSAHHFKAIQFPFNLGMPEALTNQNQTWENESISLIEAAKRANLLMFTSASLLQGRLAEKLPEKIRALFPECKSQAECALQFVRSTPGITSALVGMKSISHITENLGINQLPPLSLDQFFNLFAPRT